MKKSVKILAAVTAFILIGGILWFANGLLGNPISKVLVNNTAKKYIDKNYSHMNLNISEVSFVSDTILPSTMVSILSAYAAISRS